jgi:hypothetical protein
MIARNLMADPKNYGRFGLLLRIFRKIRPFRVPNPVFTTNAIGEPLSSKTFAPSNNQQLSSLRLFNDTAGNFPIGMFSPVKLASLTYT